LFCFSFKRRFPTLLTFAAVALVPKRTQVEPTGGEPPMDPRGVTTGWTQRYLLVLLLFQEKVLSTLATEPRSGGHPNTEKQHH
jgi:hypothetical protein